MNARLKYIIEGQLKTAGKTDIDWTELAVQAVIGGKEVAQAKADKEGYYNLTFEYGECSPTTELRVVPAKLLRQGALPVALHKMLTPTRYVLMKHSAPVYQASVDVVVPKDYLDRFRKVTQTYHMHGVVYATVFLGDDPISADPLPAAKIEFYEHSKFFLHPRDTYLGYTYTEPDGSYVFDFDFNHFGVNMWLFSDKTPDMFVRIYQFVGGIWTQVYRGPVDWDIALDFHRDYFIPAEDTFAVLDPGVKPDEGFRYVSVGLLPIDNTRIVQGYATSQDGDPISLSAQPFCGTLRIFGLFAAAPPVATYKVQVADADEDGPTGTWEDVADALTNLKWNEAERRWDPVGMGPDPATGHYQNIDIEPEADWLEHALKVTWNSANKPDGYYALRVVGYDAAGTEVGTFEMPVIRVDNTPPAASVEALETALGAVTDCGYLALPAAERDRWIRFRITAYDSEGHVLRYSISGTRGKNAMAVGATMTEERPTAHWEGVADQNKEFVADVLPAELAGCPAVAYNFELHVYGSPTNCYSSWLESQHVKKEVNLVIAG